MSDTRPVYKCLRCDSVIPFLWMGDNEDATNLDNGLSVVFTGSYGEFRDNLAFMGENGEEEGYLRSYFCHDCAHALCDWMGIDTDGWHYHPETKEVTT